MPAAAVKTNSFILKCTIQLCCLLFVLPCGHASNKIFLINIQCYVHNGIVVLMVVVLIQYTSWFYCTKLQIVVYCNN